mmetsp:Transcript_16113/g.27236  ORF Transcript_16113/g.27236 Transcript_16113/m.27236 type:complete len:254 (-) Transcript_16113:257-1018(-)
MVLSGEGLHRPDVGEGFLSNVGGGGLLVRDLLHDLPHKLPVEGSEEEGGQHHSQGEQGHLPRDVEEHDEHDDVEEQTLDQDADLGGERILNLGGVGAQSGDQVACLSRIEEGHILRNDLLKKSVPHGLTDPLGRDLEDIPLDSAEDGARSVDDHPHDGEEVDLVEVLLDDLVDNQTDEQRVRELSHHAQNVEHETGDHEALELHYVAPENLLGLVPEELLEDWVLSPLLKVTLNFLLASLGLVPLASLRHFPL